MNAENFCYWLRGRTEDRDLEPPSRDEWQLILDHLGLVFGVEPPARALEPSCDHEWGPGLKPGADSSCRHCDTHLMDAELDVECEVCGHPEIMHITRCEGPCKPQPGPAEQWSDATRNRLEKEKADPYQLGKIPLRPACAHAEFQTEYGTKIGDPVMLRCVACGYKKPHPEAQRQLVC